MLSHKLAYTYYHSIPTARMTVGYITDEIRVLKESEYVLMWFGKSLGESSFWVWVSLHEVRKNLNESHAFQKF